MTCPRSQTRKPCIRSEPRAASPKPPIPLFTKRLFPSVPRAVFASGWAWQLRLVEEGVSNTTLLQEQQVETPLPHYSCCSGIKQGQCPPRRLLNLFFRVYLLFWFLLCNLMYVLKYLKKKEKKEAPDSWERLIMKLMRSFAIKSFLWFQVNLDVLLIVFSLERTINWNPIHSFTHSSLSFPSSHPPFLLSFLSPLVI